jgi:hypothetical protein
MHPPRLSARPARQAGLAPVGDDRWAAGDQQLALGAGIPAAAAFAAVSIERGSQQYVRLAAGPAFANASGTYFVSAWRPGAPRPL